MVARLTSLHISYVIISILTSTYFSNRRMDPIVVSLTRKTVVILVSITSQTRIMASSTSENSNIIKSINTRTLIANWGSYSFVSCLT